MTNCLFCKIIEGTIPSHKIYEDEDVFAFLDIGPVTVGHTLFVPKVHATDLEQGSEHSATALMRAIHRIAPKIVKALGATGYNLGMNHGVDAGQEVFHTHLHVMPRFEGKARTFVKTHPAQDELKAIAEKITAHIDQNALNS